MEMLHLTQYATPWLGDINFWFDLGQQGALWHTSWDWNVLAQLDLAQLDLAQFDTDVFRPTREFFNHFVKSGQIWALLIGIVLGYLLRSLTSYG